MRLLPCLTLASLILSTLGDTIWVATWDLSCAPCADAADLINQVRDTVVAVPTEGVPDFPHPGASALTGRSSCFVRFEGEEVFARGVVGAMMACVTGVEPDLEVSIQDAPNSWGLDRIDQRSLPLSETPFDPAYTGAGQRVYVLDTGVNPAHEEFQGRAVVGASFINETPEVDNHGHGTHVAGTVAGATVGVASRAEVVAVKVLSRRGQGTVSSILAGLQWVVDDADGEASVINLSLGGGESAALDAGVRMADREGHIVVVAAGNDGKSACLFSPARTGGGARDNTGGVVSVGASDIEDSLSRFSNHGPCVDIVAPGSGIVSADFGKEEGLSIKSGTSMAAPHVAGVTASLLEKHGGDKRAALDNLFSLAVSGRLKGLKEETPDLLLQAELARAGPPTPPTPEPTPRPTPRPATLCLDNGLTCADFIHSNFGRTFDLLGLVRGPLVLAPTDMCQPLAEPNATLRGKVVMVDRGGCFFFDKARNLEDAGARAVLFRAGRFDTLFAPEYFGAGVTNMASCLVRYQHTESWIARQGDVVRWGSPDLGKETDFTPFPTRAPTPPPSPTAKPTWHPTPQPTLRACETYKLWRKCRARSNRCSWEDGACRTKET